MTFGSLFAGIGGMDLGLERAGMTCKWQVEIDPFCQKVLAKHWPEVPKHGDIREITGDELERVDIIAGGFPCQDVSTAGLRKGIGIGTRSGLYADMLRLVDYLRPCYVLMENVAGLLVPGNADEPAPISRVLGDLAEIRFNAEWESLPASAFGAHHQRDRVFIVAYSESLPIQHGIFRGRDFYSNGQTPLWPTFGSFLPRMADGVPNRVDRLRALGNAVVPQVAEWIGRRIMEAQREQIGGGHA